LDECRDNAIKRLSYIVPHHCGDHTTCLYSECKFVQLERHFVAKYNVEFPEKKATQEEIKEDHRSDILQEYAKISRFNGKVMSMGKRGQDTVYKEITKRLDATNIDRVALAMSGNDCENVFGMLAKYSHGKRILLGQTDSWEVYQMLVACKKSDYRFEDTVQAYDGIVSSYIRDAQTAKLIRRKHLDRNQQRGQKCKQRRKVRQCAKLKDAVKNNTASARHRPNKLSPKDACKSMAPAKQNSDAKPKPTRKRKTRCKNCQLAHSGPCAEPKYEETSKQKKKRKVEEEDDGFLNEMYQTLFAG